MHLSKSKQKGMSLLEMILVVGIIALIIVGVLSYLRSITEATNVTIETQNIRNLTRDIETLYAQQADYFQLNNEILKLSGALPYRMTNGTAGNDIATAWRSDGVDVSVVASAFLPPGIVAYDITYKGVPDDSCVDMVSSIYQEYDAISINGLVAIGNIPDIVTGCSIDATTVGLINNSIQFRKYRDR